MKIDVDSIMARYDREDDRRAVRIAASKTTRKAKRNG